MGLGVGVCGGDGGVVTIKQAVESALLFAVDMLGLERAKGARVEEVDSTADAWLITLSNSFVVNPDDPPTLSLWSTGKREYKTYTVRKSDGEVTSMKIRDLAAV